MSNSRTILEWVIDGEEKLLILEIKDFEHGSALNVEDLLQVDYSNILGDIITFPVVYNRLAFIRAEIDNLLRESEFDFSVYEAQLYEKYEKELTREVKTSRSERMEPPTKTQVMNAIIQLKEYKLKKYELLKIKKQADIVNGLYWSAQSKDRKLDAISDKLSPKEFEKEILEGTINSVMIKVRNNPMPNKRRGPL